METSFTEIGNFSGISRHVTRELYVYQRKLHPKKSFKYGFTDKLTIKRRISLLKSDGKKVY